MLQYLLDTNIVIYVMKQRPISAMGLFNSHAGRMAISTITLAELIHGAEKSKQREQNLRAIENFCSRLTVLDYTEAAAYHYGSIRAALERRGQSIGVNDLHIAAQARSAGLIVVTNNLSEFCRVPGLLTENWVS